MWPNKVLGPTVMESGRKVDCACRVPGHARAETMQLITAFSMIGNVRLYKVESALWLTGYWPKEVDLILRQIILRTPLSLAGSDACISYYNRN